LSVSEASTQPADGATVHIAELPKSTVAGHVIVPEPTLEATRAYASAAKLAAIVWGAVTFENAKLVAEPTEPPSTRTSETW
jgi:hypothetical protein